MQNNRIRRLEPAPAPATNGQEFRVRSGLVRDGEFHRRRAEAEMEQALRARRPEEARLHLELARIHRQRRDELAMSRCRSNGRRAAPISRTDKEC